MNKNILLIDTGGETINFIYDMIPRPDITIYIAVPKKQSWMSKHTSLDNVIECDVYDYDSLQQAVKEFAEEKSLIFDGIGTYYDSFVTQMAKLSAELNTTNISLIAAEQSSSNKFKMRERCTDKGVQMPKYSLIRNATPDVLLKTITDFNAPCVVKPIMGWKSFGVKKFEGSTTIEDVKEIFNLTSEEQADYFKNFAQDFLIEEYLSGPLLSVDGFIQNGNIHIAGMIEFILGPEPHFTVEKNYIPARLNHTDEQQCMNYTKEIIEALEFDDCGFHCELRLTAEGPRLIEIACRLPGGPLQLGYQQAYGINLASNLIDIWLGKETELAPSKTKYVAQKAIYVHKNGTLKSITGIELLSTNEDVWAHAQITEIGEEIKTYPEAPEPIYFYAAQSNTPENLSVIEEEVEASISITIA